MSNRNYSQYSNKNNKNNKPKNTHQNVAPENAEIKPIEYKDEPVIANVVPETVDTVAVPEQVEGIVVNCARLNVRSAPSTDADVLCILDAMSEITIDVSKSHRDWVFVCTASGIEGYCMKQFIEASL